MATRRRGVPYKRGNKWVGGIDFNGKKRWVGSFDRPEEWKLEAAALRLKLTKESSEEAVPPAKTIREYVEVDGWPSSGGRDERRRATTIEPYEEALAPFLREFGDRPLDRGIPRKEARTWAAAHPAAARVVRTLFNDAKDDELTDANPFERLRLEAVRGRRGIRVLTTEEFALLGDVARRSRADEYGQVLQAAVTWQGTVGTRNGETFAVEWSHIDFEANRIEIVQRFDPKGRLGPPKNGQERTVILAPPAKELLLTMPRLHERFVFVTVRGRTFRQSTWAYYWHPLRAGFTAILPDSHWLPRRMANNPNDALDFYELRHRAATWLWEPRPRGLGLTAFDTSIQLGHTDGGILVRKLYGHPEKEGALERINDAMQNGIEAEGDEW